ncbi:MAG: hypothetical protein QXP38_00105 [Nitrososphaerota archaeon]
MPRSVLEELKELTGAKTYAEAIDMLMNDVYGENSRIIIMNQDLIEKLKELALMVDEEEYKGLKRVVLLFLIYLKKSLLAAELDLVEQLYRTEEDDEWRKLLVEILAKHLKKRYGKKKMEEVIRT